MATHSSVLTWKTPLKEEPGGLQSWGCKELETIEHIRVDKESQSQFQIHKMLTHCKKHPISSQLQERSSPWGQIEIVLRAKMLFIYFIYLYYYYLLTFPSKILFLPVETLDNKNMSIFYSQYSYPS